MNKILLLGVIFISTFFVGKGTFVNDINETEPIKIFQEESSEVLEKVKEDISKKTIPPKKIVIEKKTVLPPPSIPKQVPPSSLPKLTEPSLNVNSIIPYIVKVECERTQGSGTIIRTQNGGLLVLTNNHVTTGEDYCVVITHNKEKYLVVVDGYVEDLDFSSLKFLEAVNFLPSAISCTPEEIKIGKDITLFGFPGTENVVITKGKILGRIEGKGDEGDLSQWLSASAKIDAGNSGGGAFLNNGCFAGIPTAMFVDTKDSIIHYIGWR